MLNEDASKSAGLILCPSWPKIKRQPKKVLIIIKRKTLKKGFFFLDNFFSKIRRNFFCNCRCKVYVKVYE